MVHARGASLGGWLVLLWVSAAAAEREPDTLPVPPVPVGEAHAVALPAVPRFAWPAPDGDHHDVRELRINGHGLLGRELTVRGYITGIYSCLEALARRGEPTAATQRRIDDNPQLCELPKFYLGARADAPPDAALWVVDVPRPANQRERIALTRAQLDRRPPVPRLTRGELVAVTGTFALRSPGGEQDSRGLLVYQRLAHLPPGMRPGPLVSASDAPPPPPLAAGRPMRAVVPVRVRNASIDDYELCNQALEAHQLTAALAACRAALAAWDGNHLAWYALGNAFATRDDWRAARDAYARAAALRPDAAMYQLYDGLASYQLAIQLAGGAPRSAPLAGQLAAIEREVAGRGRVLLPVRLAAALAAARLTPAATFADARRALAGAVQRAPRSWQAQYYLGRTELELDHPHAAAAAFTAAIEADPAQAAPYIALIALYRAWELDDQGLAVAQQASAHVAAGDLASAWYEIGMAYDARRRDPEAIAAFARAIAAGASPRARFQRGQVYLRVGELDRAQRDLEAVLLGGDPSLSLARQLARGLLSSIERTRAANAAYLRNGSQLTGTLDSR